MKRVVAGLAVGLMLVGLGGLAGATAPRPGPRVVYPLVQADATTETLIAITRTDAGPGDRPIHLNFFDKDCLVRDRQDELTPLDVDVYVYSGFATGIAKGAAEIHWAIPGAPLGSGPVSLVGEAVILNFAADTMIGYSGIATFTESETNFPASISDQVLALPHFLAEVPGVLTNEIALAAIPSGFLGDKYPSASSDIFTVRWRMYDGNEEEASAQTTWKCVLHAPLSSIFGPITTLGLLAADDQGGPHILFYPYGWVRAAIKWAPSTADCGGADCWGAAGIFRQQYVDGTFSWGEATNLWELNGDSCQEAVDGVCF